MEKLEGNENVDQNIRRQHQRSVSDTQDIQYRDSLHSSDTNISDSGTSTLQTLQAAKPSATPLMNRKNNALRNLQRQMTIQRIMIDPTVSTVQANPSTFSDNFSFSNGMFNGSSVVPVDGYPTKQHFFPASPHPSAALGDNCATSSISVKLEDPQPTSSEEKSAWTWVALAENTSIMYAIYLVSMGIVIYMADIFAGPNAMIAEGYNLFLLMTQFVWLLAVHIDARRFIHKVFHKAKRARSKDELKEQKVYLEETDDGKHQLRFDLQDSEAIPLFYGFSSEGSIYIKIGATVFCFGHMIHTGLTLGQQILYAIDDNPVLNACYHPVSSSIAFLQPVCAFYQLFFIFKYSNLIINCRLVLARFGLMHSIGTSLCYWTYTIIQETLQAIYSKKYDYEDTSYPNNTNLHAASANLEITYGCEEDTYLSSMINDTAPYLYPFSIEFYILMVGLWMFLKENLGKVEMHTHIPSIEVTYEDTNQKVLTSNLVIAVDCHASNRGLFLGLLVTALTVLSIILLFILSAAEETATAAVTVNGVSEVVILSLMLLSAIIAYKFVRILDVVKHFSSNVDDILLYVTLPCIFLYAFLRIVPAALNGDGLFVSVCILQVLQVIVQTALIHDGLRRRSNSSELQHKKPGREIITFLVVTNVALWLLQTFEIKSVESNSALYDFYGKELWTTLAHLTLPFALFYRFHSSVCLADMWKECYEPDHS